MERHDLQEAYEEEIGRGYPDKEKNDRQMYFLAQELGVPVTAVQLVDLQDWRRQDKTLDRETRQMVADIKAGNTTKWEMKAKAQMKAAAKRRGLVK